MFSVNNKEWIQLKEHTARVNAICNALGNNSERIIAVAQAIGLLTGGSWSIAADSLAKEHEYLPPEQAGKTAKHLAEQLGL